VAPHTRPSVDDLDDLEHREHAVVFLCDAGQIRHGDRHELGQRSVALSGDPVAAGAGLDVFLQPAADWADATVAVSPSAAAVANNLSLNMAPFLLFLSRRPVRPPGPQPNMADRILPMETISFDMNQGASLA
jgi:hypothetical protein